MAKLGSEGLDGQLEGAPDGSEGLQEGSEGTYGPLGGLEGPDDRQGRSGGLSVY